MVFWAKHLQMDPTKGFWGPRWAKFNFVNLYPPLIWVLESDLMGHKDACWPRCLHGWHLGRVRGLTAQGDQLGGPAEPRGHSPQRAASPNHALKMSRPRAYPRISRCALPCALWNYTVTICFSIRVKKVTWISEQVSQNGENKNPFAFLQTSEHILLLEMINCNASQSLWLNFVFCMCQWTRATGNDSSICVINVFKSATKWKTVNKNQ